MKLIKELTEEVHYITENSNEGKKFFIEGIIMQGDIKNRNGRIYPSSVLMKEMNRYNNEYVSKKRAFGELGHPSNPTINLDRVSHLFTELRQDGSNAVGKARVVDTPMGNIVKNLISEGASLGISSRGMGSVKTNKEGIMEVQSDFILATAGDIVADPSAPSAFVNGIMEGAEWVFDLAVGWRPQNELDRIVEEIKPIKKKISSVDIKQLEEQKIDWFKRFLGSFK